jgi:hypothetical protein
LLARKKYCRKTAIKVVRFRYPASGRGMKKAFWIRRQPAPLPEPEWEEVLSNPDERRAAAHYWREITTAMRASGTLKPANSHAVLRLVTAYLIFDRVSAVNMRGGQIDVQAWAVHLEASRLASQIEADLGFAPGRVRT